MWRGPFGRQAKLEPVKRDRNSLVTAYLLATWVRTADLTGLIFRNCQGPKLLPKFFAARQRICGICRRVYAGRSRARDGASMVPLGSARRVCSQSVLFLPPGTVTSNRTPAASIADGRARGRLAPVFSEGIIGNIAGLDDGRASAFASRMHRCSGRLDVSEGNGLHTDRVIRSRKAPPSSASHRYRGGAAPVAWPSRAALRSGAGFGRSAPRRLVRCRLVRSGRDATRPDGSACRRTIPAVIRLDIVLRHGALLPRAGVEARGPGSQAAERDATGSIAGIPAPRSNWIA